MEQVNRLAKAAGRLAAENSFAFVADRLVEKKNREGRVSAALEKMKWALDKVRSKFSDRSIAEITTPQIIAVLKLEEETASDDVMNGATIGNLSTSSGAGSWARTEGSACLT